MDASQDPLGAVESYLALYGLLHSLWHVEDLWHTRNAYGLGPPVRLQSIDSLLNPPLTSPLALRTTAAAERAPGETVSAAIESESADVLGPAAAAAGTPWQPGGDVRLPGGTYYLGTEREEGRAAPLVLDCEK
jgi:hypothetical protein